MNWLDGIKVRQAMWADLEGLASLLDLYRQFEGCKPDPDAARLFLRDRFDHGDATLWLAECAGEAVGFVQLFPMYSTVSLARVYVLNDLFVRADVRGHGVGRRLMDAALGYAHAMGAVEVSLVVTTQNSPARLLYESYGWKCDAAFLYYVYDPREKLHAE